MTSRIFIIPGLTSTITTTNDVGYFGDSYWGGSYWGGVWFEWTGETLFGVPNERTFSVNSESRVYAVREGDRVFTIECQNSRVYAISIENRVYSIECEED
jgi:hypothetical protein